MTTHSTNCGRWRLRAFTPFAFCQPDDGRAFQPALLVAPGRREIRAVNALDLPAGAADAIERSVALLFTVRPGIYAPDVRDVLCPQRSVLSRLASGWAGVRPDGHGVWTWSIVEQVWLVRCMYRLGHRTSFRQVWTIAQLAHWFPLHAEGSLAARVVRAFKDDAGSRLVDYVLRPLREARPDVVVPHDHLRQALPGVLRSALAESQRYALAGRATQIQHALHSLRRSTRRRIS